MTRFLTSNAWNIDAASKIDVLIEPNHTGLIRKFLSDSQTSIEREESASYILYGREEALLVIPSRTSMKLLLLYLFHLKHLVRN